MKKEPKKGIQEIILQFLHGKRALSTEKLSKRVEEYLENEESHERKVKPKYVINRTIKQLVADNMLEEYTTEQSSFVGLTAEGRHKLRNIKLSSQNHLVSTHWDGYWRIVIVDIPESRKKDKDAIRYILKKAQFVQIKQSVWISPYPLEHMMINMKKDLGLEEELMVFVTDKIDNTTQNILEQKFMKHTEEK